MLPLILIRLLVYRLPVGNLNDYTKASQPIFIVL